MSCKKIRICDGCGREVKPSECFYAYLVTSSMVGADVIFGTFAYKEKELCADCAEAVNKILKPDKYER